LSSDDELVHLIADQLAVTDVVLRSFELVDAKDFEQMNEVFTEDAIARWNPETAMEGRSQVVGAMQHMVGTPEIVTYHHVASMVPAIKGDTAEVNVHVRAMHWGVGPREGTFYESLVIQPTWLARTPGGWRIKQYDWHVQVKLGSMEELFAPELAARPQASRA
jgi:ketosteroid isomerase-like protein